MRLWSPRRSFRSRPCVAPAPIATRRRIVPFAPFDPSQTVAPAAPVHRRIDRNIYPSQSPICVICLPLTTLEPD
jgi:hypothetical protein